MICNEKVKEAKRLLDLGVTRQDVAERLEISSSLVGMIAQGKRRPESREKKQDNRYAPNPRYARAPAHKCKECGKQIVMKNCMHCDMERKRLHDRIERELKGCKQDNEPKTIHPTG